MSEVHVNEVVGRKALSGVRPLREAKTGPARLAEAPPVAREADSGIRGRGAECDAKDSAWTAHGNRLAGNERTAQGGNTDQNIDMASNDLSESFALRRRPESKRVTAQSTL